jgi:8-oxo-dGTP pyrophosphatase MutT (NUDIX family)
MRDEAALMDLTGEEAEAWVADETALDIVRDDDVIDGRDPLDIADPDDFALWDDFTAVSGYREQMKGSGTRYGYDDETVDDFYAAQRSMLGEWGDRWGSSGGSGTGSKYSSVGWTFGGGSGGGSYGKQSSWESPESKAKRLGEPVTVAFGKKGSGDGYVYFPDGERRWGIYGASGILLRNVDETGTERFFLAQRGNVSGGAGMWAIPGGALDEGETPVQGAMREFTEEIQVGNVNVTVHGEHRDEYHSSWAYTSVVADVDHQFAPPEKLDWETKAVGWFTREEIADLPKHPGLEKTLDSLFGLYSSKV